MSNSHSHAEDGAHAGPIKNPKQLLWTVLAAFVIPIFIIIGLVLFVTSAFMPAGTNEVESMSLAGVTEEARDRAQAARLQKVGMVEIRDANRPLKSGEEVYKAQCAACHAAGVAGAPKLADASAWAPRIKQGYEALLTAVLKGKGAMGPQGGGDFEDLELGRAVVYMANSAGGNLPEPSKAPAAAAADASAPPGAETIAAVPAAQAAKPGALIQPSLVAPAPAPAAEGAAAASPATPPSTKATTLAATTESAASAPAAPGAAAAPAAAAAVAAVAPSPAPAAPAAAPAVDKAAGEALYKSACFACHASGVANAPKFGDKAAWAPHIAEGMDAMLAAVKTGKGAMPPRGGSTATDEQLRAAIQYMVDAAK